MFRFAIWLKNNTRKRNFKNLWIYILISLWQYYPLYTLLNASYSSFAFTSWRTSRMTLTSDQNFTLSSSFGLSPATQLWAFSSFQMANFGIGLLYCWSSEVLLWLWYLQLILYITHTWGTPIFYFHPRWEALSLSTWFCIFPLQVSISMSILINKQRILRLPYTFHYMLISGTTTRHAPRMPMSRSSMIRQFKLARTT